MPTSSLDETIANRSYFIPILWDSGPERQLLRESGIRVATDGMTIEV
jgi:hypothetical protein